MSAILLALPASSDASPVRNGERALPDVAAACDTTLVVRGDGTAWSWGAGPLGQRGDGTTSSGAAPGQVLVAPGTPLTDITAVASGCANGFALRADGAVFAWGSNEHGQLGSGSAAGPEACGASPCSRYAVRVQTGAGPSYLTEATHLAAGNAFVVARRSDGSVWTWGRNDSGQLGTQSTSGPSTCGGVACSAFAIRVQDPAQAGGFISGIVDVAAGTATVVAQRADGTLRAWGDATDGATGSGASAGSTLAPSAVQLDTAGFPVLDRVRGIDGAGRTFRAVRSDGTLVTWGAGGSGQLGNATSTPAQPRATPVLDPVLAAPLDRVRSIGGGAENGLAVRADGTVLAWGRNDWGQLGDATQLQRTRPVALRDSSAPFTLALRGAMGATHAVVARADGTVWTLGRDHLGQLGLAVAPPACGADPCATTARQSQLGVGNGYVAVSASEYTSYALRADGTVWSWGDNRDGELGIGTEDGIATSPQQVMRSAGVPLDGIVAIAGGAANGFALRADGTAWAWGDNAEGQLARGHQNDSDWAVQMRASGVADALDVIQVGAIDDASYLLGVDGRIRATGRNSHGTLGDNTTSRRTYPVTVQAWGGAILEGITLLGTDGGDVDTPIVLRDDGTAWTWGQNREGELGLGTNVGPQTCASACARRAVQVLARAGEPFTGVAQVGASYGTSHLVTAAGEAWSWGSNDTGQVGNATTATADVLFPRRVATNDTNTAWLDRAVRISSGDYSPHALTADGRLVGWGENVTGQVGDGTTLSPRTWTSQVVGIGGPGVLERITDVGDGANHGIARDGSGRVVTWGADGFGQLGSCSPTYTPRHHPDLVQAACPNGPPIIAETYQHRSDSSVINFGSWTNETSIRVDVYGLDPDGGDSLRAFVELRPVGQPFASTCGDTADPAIFASGVVGPTTLGEETIASAVVTGLVDGGQYRWRVCAIDGGGAGQAGPWYVPSGSPHVSVDLSSGSGMFGTKQVSARCDSTGALRADGTVWMAGDSGRGQLGDGSTSGSSTTPVQVRLAPAGAVALTEIRSLAVGCGFALAVRADGTVWAWGANQAGQLGATTATTCGGVACSPYAVQVDPANVTGVKEVAAGGASSYALRADGRLLAWGDNSGGQLGRGAVGGSSATAAFVRNTGNTADLSSIVSVAAGTDFAVASDSGGSAWSWGLNDDFRLGAGHPVGTGHGTAQQVLSAAATPLTRVRRVAVGTAHAFALIDDGTIQGWGENAWGQVGVNAAPGDVPYASPVRDSGGVTMDRFTHVAAGDRHSLAIRADGTAWAWGHNAAGQLSQATTTGSACSGSCELVPVAIRDSGGAVVGTAGSRFKSVAAGLSHSVALKASSETFTWGSDAAGQLGRGGAGGSTTSLVASAFQSGAGFIQVASHGYGGFALAADGTVRSWGDAMGGGALGNGETGGQTPRLQLVQVGADTPLADIVSIGAGAQSGYAIRADGTVWAWGEGGSGRLGNNGTSDRPFAVQVRASSAAIDSGIALTDAVQVVGHDQGAMALDVSGRVWSWGENERGELASGSCCADRSYAGLALRAAGTPLDRVTAIGSNAAEGDDSFAVRSDGSAWAWGQNDDGQLAQGTAIGPNTCGTTPCSWFALQVLVDGSLVPLTDVTEITAADGVGFARTASGGVWSWGDGADSALGNNGTTDRFGAVPVRAASGAVDTGTPLADVVSLGAGSQHGQAVRADGRMLAWGHNSTQQLGIGGGGNAASAWAQVTKQPGGSDMTGALATGAAGADHSLVVDASGRVRAAGANFLYQLADCTKAQRSWYEPIRDPCPGNRAPDVRWLEQYDSSFTRIARGAWTRDGISNFVHIALNVSDPDPGEMVTPFLEFAPVGTSFTASCGDGAHPNVRAGVAQSLSTPGDADPYTWDITGLQIGTQYHWRVCAVDSSGAASDWSMFGPTPFPDFGVDDSRPANPGSVDDGPTRGVDVDVSYSLSVLEATWPYGIDAGGSGLVSYDYCVTTSPAGGDCAGAPVRAWTYSGYEPDVRATGLSLSHGTTYYVCVRAIDGAGNQALGHVCSDGQQVRFAFTAVNPNAAVQGDSGILVELTGAGFLPTDAVTISGTGITIQSVTRISDTRLDVVVDIAAGATAGARNVTVQRTGGDTSQVTRTGAFTVVALSISVSVSTLGFDDPARDATPPNAVGFGTLLPGDVRFVGPAGSGQATAGAAAQVTVVANGPWRLQASGSDFSAGGETIPASALSWKRSGVTEAWTPFTTSAATVDGAGAGNAANAPGGTTSSYDWRVAVPAAQAPGAYVGTVTYTAIPAV